MRGVLAGGSRKRLNVEAPGLPTEYSVPRNKPALVTSLVHNKAGRLEPKTSGGPVNVLYSSAAFNANDLSSDQRVLQEGGDHLFSAIFKSSSPTARGGNYLRQHLYEELLAQQRKSPGDLVSALHNSIAELNKGFQSLHPFNLDVLQGLRVVVAFVDFKSHKLLVASNGGCRCILGKSHQPGSVEVVADVGCQAQTDLHNDVAPINNIIDMHLDSNVDFLLLGSSGFWREVAPFKAALRTHHFFETAPHASNASAAANLINYSLHCVTQRMKAHTDRRMTSLNSVSNLVSLQAGNKGQFKYGHKQPVRRRRGDVHEDITTIVAYFDWKGPTDGVVSPVQRLVGGQKLSKWAVVRMVYNFHIKSKQSNIVSWRILISQVLQQVRNAKQNRQPLSILKNSLHSKASWSRSSDESTSSETSAYSS